LFKSDNLADAFQLTQNSSLKRVLSDLNEKEQDPTYVLASNFISKSDSMDQLINSFSLLFIKIIKVFQTKTQETQGDVIVNFLSKNMYDLLPVESNE